MTDFASEEEVPPQGPVSWPISSGWPVDPRGVGLNNWMWAETMVARENREATAKIILMEELVWI